MAVVGGSCIIAVLGHTKQNRSSSLATEMRKGETGAVYCPRSRCLTRTTHTHVRFLSVFLCISVSLSRTRVRVRTHARTHAYNSISIVLGVVACKRPCAHDPRACIGKGHGPERVGGGGGTGGERYVSNVRGGADSSVCGGRGRERPMRAMRARTGGRRLALDAVGQRVFACVCARVCLHVFCLSVCVCDCSVPDSCKERCWHHLLENTHTPEHSSSAYIGLRMTAQAGRCHVTPRSIVISSM